MAPPGQNTTMHFDCVPKSSGTMSIIVTFLALPFHILMVKILWRDIQLPTPRDRIMLSLSVSDLLQILAIFFTAAVMQSFELTTESATCRILRDIALFTSTLTLTVSSLVIITLSIERKTICMDYLKFHKMFSRQRTAILLSSFWAVGLALAIITAALADEKITETLVTELTTFQVIAASLILPSAVIITVIQLQLFLFSRSRIAAMLSAKDSNSTTDGTGFKTRQLRIAFIAGIVSLAYTVCMVPLAAVGFLQVTQLVHTRASVKAGIICLSLANNLLDPFIYGIGIRRTRKILLRNIRSVVSWYEVASSLKQVRT